MKRIIYMVAAFSVLVGCSKTEMTAPMSEGTRNLAVSVTVDNGTSTKSFFDGDSRLKFESGDCFYAAVAKAETPTTAVKVAAKEGAAASVYASKFTIADAAAETPMFNGHLYSIVEDDFAEEYIFYGLYPGNYSAYYNEGWENLQSWTIDLPASQKSTQTTWAEDADIMIVKPIRISTADNTYDSKYQEYTTSQSESVKFAHLFGFGKFTFNGVPSEYADEVVKSVKIEAVGDNRNLVGKFKLDITKPVDEIELAPYSTSATITLDGDKKTTVSDYVAWFVANPGTYDVKVTVETGKATLVFDRQGLEISRSEIAAPVVNYRESDTVESHDVVLVDGECWDCGPFTYSNCFSSSYSSRVWGIGEKKMEFTLSFNSTNEHYGSAQYVSSDKYIQLLSNNNEITGGEITVASAASFKGVKRIKLNLGNYTDGVTNDFTVKLVNGNKENILGKVSVTGSSATADLVGTNFYFSTTEGQEDGQLIIFVDNLSNNRCKPYIGALVINPAPDIVLEETAVKVGKDAAAGTVGCTISLADTDPEITTDADWLEASYSDGKISYSVLENTGSKRTATINVTATGLSQTVRTITVTQASANAFEAKLSVTSADIWPLIEAAKTADPTATYADLNGSFTAKATDGSDKTVEIALSMTNVNLEASTEDAFKTRSGRQCKVTCKESIGEITEVIVICDKKTSTSNWADLLVKFSTDGSKWDKAAYFTVSDGAAPYTNTITNDNDAYTWFSIEPTVYSIVTISSFDITFVCE